MLLASGRFCAFTFALCALVFAVVLCSAQDKAGSSSDLSQEHLKNIRFVEESPGATADTEIQSAIAALGGKGGIVMATSLSGSQSIRSTVVIPANVTVILGPATFTCALSARANGSFPGNPCWHLSGSNARLIGMGMGDSAGFSTGSDPAPDAAIGVTNLVCNGCSATTDMILVATAYSCGARPCRSALTTVILGNPEVASLYINMGNSGRKGVRATTVDAGSFHDIAVFNCIDDCFDLEGAPEGESGFQTYHNRLYHLWLQPSGAVPNPKFAALHLDARFSEIAWTTIDSVRGSGNIFNGGGLVGLLAEAGATSNTNGINKLYISSSYFGNVKDVPNCFGIQLKAPGNVTKDKEGQIRQVQIINTLAERLFRATRGTAIGGTDGNNMPSGQGIMAVTLMSPNAGANWAKVVDSASLGQHEVEIGDDVHGYSGSSVTIGGLSVGQNSAGYKSSEVFLPNGDNQNYFGLYIAPSVVTGGFSGASVFGAFLNGAGFKKDDTNGGSVSRAYGLFVTKPSIGANNYAVYADNIQVGSTGSSQLGNAANGTMIYCQDCTVASPSSCRNVTTAPDCSCRGGGAGAIAKRINGLWLCN